MGDDLDGLNDDALGKIILCVIALLFGAFLLGFMAGH